MMFSKPAQVGLVVRDLDRTINNLSEILGIDGFQRVRYPPEEWSEEERKRANGGKPIDYVVWLAFAKVGNLEFELIQPVEGDNIWRTFLEEHGGGLHHIRFTVEDAAPTQNHLALKGMPLVESGIGPRTGAPWMYFDSASAIGFVIEIAQAGRSTE